MNTKATNIHRRGTILFPIIPESGLAILYGSSGTGKTYVALSIAYAVSQRGSVFGKKWVTEKQCKVLFVDGEMAASVLQERLAKIALSDDRDQIDPRNFNILAADLQKNGIPDLASPESQQLIEEHLEGVELLILDNLSSLSGTYRENESESWHSMQEWLLSLKRRHISVLIVEDTNKICNLRRHLKKEDILDTVIVLRRNKTYDPQEGAPFEVHYEKAPAFCGFYGKNTNPFEAWLRANEGKLWWEIIELEKSEQQSIIQLHNEGLKQREISAELNISQARVCRRLKKAKEEGLID